MLWICAGVTAIAGCTTVFNAREAQKAVAALGDGKVEREGRGGRSGFDLRGYSMSQLVDFALTNRPSVVAAQLAAEDARLALKELAADAPLLSSTPWTAPKVSLSGGYSASSEQSPSRLTWDTEGNASAALSLDLPIVDFGRHSAKMDAAVENVIAAELSHVQAEYTVFGEVATAYFDALEADALLIVAKTNVFECEEHLRRAQEMLDAGEVLQLDVIRARRDLSEFQEALVAASNKVVTSGANLLRVLGIDADEGVREKVLPPFPDALLVVVRGFGDTTFDVSTAFSLAQTNAPSMAIRRARLRAASDQVDAAIADLLPTVSASVSLNWTDPMWFWRWGVNGVQTIFQGFRKTTAIDRAVVAMKTAATALEETEQELSYSIEIAIATRDNAIKACQTAATTMRFARENLEMVKAQYEEGEASRVDFTDAISDYSRALGSCVSAFYSGQKSEARLFELIGRMPMFREIKVEEIK